MFSAGGATYVYLIYGMHYCFNVVTAAEDEPHAVLIRAVEPLTARDAELMAAYRGIAVRKPSDLSGGPGKLCRALRIDKSLNMARLDLRGGQYGWSKVKPRNLWILSRLRASIFPMQKNTR